MQYTFVKIEDKVIKSIMNSQYDEYFPETYKGPRYDRIQVLRTLALQNDAEIMSTLIDKSISVIGILLARLNPLWVGFVAVSNDFKGNETSKLIQSMSVEDMKQTGYYTDYPSFIATHPFLRRVLLELVFCEEERSEEMLYIIASVMEVSQRFKAVAYGILLK